MSDSFPKEILEKAYSLMCTARALSYIYEENKDYILSFRVLNILAN